MFDCYSGIDPSRRPDEAMAALKQYITQEIHLPSGYEPELDATRIHYGLTEWPSWCERWFCVEVA